MKLLAAAAMLIDHIGILFFPQIAVFRVIGRISFPIYAFLAAEGAAKTHSPRRYLVRLGIAALLSELPFRLAFSVPWSSWPPKNVLFTLLCGVICCFVCSAKKPWVTILCTAALAAAVQLSGSDYGAYGVLAVVFFYVLRGEKIGQCAAFSMLTVLQALLAGWPLQSFAVFGLIPCALYSGERGRDLRRFFYIFYPAHLVALWAVHLLLI